MRLTPQRRGREHDASGVTGTARLDRRTTNLVRRLRPGDVAVIHHRDLDRVSAESLVGCGVSAVVNGAESVSGRFPNLGPQVITAAGIPLLDVTGVDVFTALHDGDRVRVDGQQLFSGDHLVADGELLDAERVAGLVDQARSGLSVQLEAFSFNTMELLRQEQDLLLDDLGVPDLRTRLDNRHVLLVVRGYDHRADLRMLRGYIRAHRPVLVGVDGGADALVEAGYTPDMVIGDLDQVSDGTLRCGAELVQHTRRDGPAAGSDRLERLGVNAVAFPAAGTSEDVAMLLADAKGATLIVAAGTHTTLVELLDKGRAGMAGTFLTRLRVGAKLVDARAVGRLYQSSVRAWQLLLLVASGVLALAVALSATPGGEEWLGVVVDRWDDLVPFLQERLS